MVQLSIRPYTIAAAGQPALWRLRKIVDGVLAGQAILGTGDAQRALDASRAGTLDDYAVFVRPGRAPRALEMQVSDGVSL